MSERRTPRIAILASGEGTTAEAYARDVHKTIPHEIVLVVSNKVDAPILKRAENWNKRWGFKVETAVINKTTHPDGPREWGQTAAESTAIRELLEDRKVDLVLALGYMVIINDPLISAYGFLPDSGMSKWEARMLNSHPGPLPLTAGTMGAKASAAALAAYKRGEAQASAQTLHVVSAGVDLGPSVDVNAVPIERGDTPETLFQRTQYIEKQTIALGIDKFWRRQQEFLHPTPESQDPYLRSPWST